MKFGTTSFNNKIYNLEYMNSEEIKDLLNQIEKDNDEKFKEIETMVMKKESDKLMLLI